MPLRILKPDGTGNSWLLAQAIRYASDYRVGVINLSYSVQHRSLLIDDVLSIVTSVQPGAVVAAAAGNSGGKAPGNPGADKVPRLLARATTTPYDKRECFFKPRGRGQRAPARGGVVGT